MIEPGPAHAPEKFGEAEGIDGVDAVGHAGLVRAPGKDPDRKVGVNLTELPYDGLQNGVVTGVSAPIGAADQGAVPAAHSASAVLPAEHDLIDLKLASDRRFQGVLLHAFLTQAAAQMLPLDGVAGQCDQVAGELIGVAGREQKAVDPVVDEIGDAAHSGADGGQAGARAFSESIGKGLGEGGEGIDIDGLVKGIGVGDPAGEADEGGYTEVPGQPLQHGALFAVSGDEEAEVRTGRVCPGKAADQRGDVFDRIEAGGDPHHHRVVIGVQSHGPVIGRPIHGGRRQGKVDAVVNGKELVRIKSP